jgi:hypothetical protein
MSCKPPNTVFANWGDGVTVKLDADTRRHRWNELSSDIAIGVWLDVSQEAKQEATYMR